MKLIVPIIAIALSGLFILLNGETNLNLAHSKPDKVRNSQWVEQKLASMTLREKIAQMIISNSFGYALDKNSKDYKKLRSLVTNSKIGGFIFFQGRSIEEAELINDLQSMSETPLLMSADFERGTKMRLDDGSLFPSNMSLGATRDPKLSYEMGFQIARECRAIGIHQNYAPVMDINNNPLNPIINVRSYGEDPELVSQMGDMFINGLQDGNVIATAKHFPGHGDTDIDSHSDLPIIKYGKDRLDRTELIPFKNAIDSKVRSVMIAHLSFPQIDPEPFAPASLSYPIISGILKQQLGFEGLVVTDALNMAGVTKHFSTTEVAIRCALAGVDLILMPQGEEETISAIENGVKNGTIPESRINESAAKILSAKEWLKLNENKKVNVSNISQIVNNSFALDISQRIADASITLVKNENAVPLKKGSGKYMLLSVNNGNEKANSDLFISEMRSRNVNDFPDAAVYDLSGEISSGTISEIVQASADFQNIVIPIYAKVKIKTGTVGLPASQLELINSLISSGKKVIVISFGNPYLIQGFEQVSSYICAYSDSESSIRAGVSCLLGEKRFKGKLPVSISDKYKYGDGIVN
ncbi:hypothetical protein BH10BAC5_BH10BAC5_26520 [soil metagenome]